MRSKAKISFAIAAVASFFAFAGQAFAAPTVTIDPGPTASFTTISGTGTVDIGDRWALIYAETATDPAGPWVQHYVQFLPENEGPTPISFEATGLKAGTQYFLRLNAALNNETNTYSKQVSAITLETAPPTATINPVTAIGLESAHFSGEVDTATSANPFDADWKFQCQPACKFDWARVSAGESAAVEADAPQLLPGTTYEVTLVAEGPGGRYVAGPETFTTLTAAPQVSATRVKRLVRDATVLGTVHAGGLETTYHVEYGMSVSYGKGTQPHTIPAGTGSVDVKGKLYDLTPGTTYHYRIVATNALGTVEGPDRTFTTETPAAVGNCPNEAIRTQQESTALSGCRAYELVSPVDKAGFPVHWKPYVGPIFALNGGMIAAARDGDAAVFTAWGVFAGSEGSMPQTYRSRRTASGWETTPGSSAINAPQPEMANPGTVPMWWIADYDLAEGVIQSRNAWSPFDNNRFAPNGGSTVGAMDAYVRTADDEDVLISADEEGQAIGGLDNQAMAHAPSVAGNGGHALFQLNRHVVAEDEGRSEGTYNVYEHDGNRVRLVSVAPEGGPAHPECGSSLPLVGRRTGGGSITAPQSPDGSRVVFQTSGENDSEDFFCSFLSPTQLWLRIDGERTVHVSKSQRSEPDPFGTQAAKYVGASEDFSRIFFQSQEMLTDELPPEGAPYLYEFDVDSEELTALIGSFSAIWSLSADGSSLVVDRAGSLIRLEGGEETTIATSSAVRGLGRSSGQFGLVAADDGSTVLFTSANIVGHGPQEIDQVFVWREEEGLQCLSCGEPEAGAPTHAHMSTGDESILTEVEPGRYADSISADGSVVAFDTEEPLLPSDNNGKRDVYEYNIATDRLSLVTDGRSAQDAFVLGVSRSGRDIFFTTAAALASEDIDGTVDLYDARRNGGFAKATGGASRPCGGEDCQPPAALPPAAQPPASSQLSGSGNAKHRRSSACRKQAKDKRGKKAAQRAKNRCGKGAGKGKKKAKGSQRRANVLVGAGKGEGK